MNRTESSVQNLKKLHKRAEMVSAGALRMIHTKLSRKSAIIPADQVLKSSLIQYSSGTQDISSPEFMLNKASSDVIIALLWKLLLAWLIGGTALDLDIIAKSWLNLLLKVTITFFE